MNLKQLHKRYTDPNLVLIYQFGKVGSTTLADSIEGAVNVHDLFGYHMCPYGFQQRNKWTYRKLIFPIDRALRRWWIGKRKSTDIIVPLRQPWERNLSMFFQDLPFWYVQHFVENRAKQKREGLGLLKEIFEQTFQHDACDAWFEKEFCRLTGISFDEITFDKDAGFSVIEKGTYRCLFLTTTHMSSDSGAATIGSFLGREVELSDSNRGGRKWYGAVYREFRDDKEFVDGYRKKVSDCKVQRKFFH